MTYRCWAQPAASRITTDERSSRRNAHGAGERTSGECRKWPGARVRREPGPVLDAGQTNGAELACTWPYDKIS